jgi:CubicO group peptidase (beta-lactamase class C family)
MSSRAWLTAIEPRLASAVAAFVNVHAAPGVAVGVVEGDDLIWATGFGFVDLDADGEPDASTRFRIASITKTFTATALVQLRDNGRLGLDDPLVAHLPELSVARNPFGGIDDVTLRAVLTHRSGLVSEPPLQDWRRKRFPSVAETLERADLIEVVVPPGSTDKYSNLGFQLLGEIVERASGRPFRGYVRERVLDPLHLASTGFEAEAGGRVAVGYDAPIFSDHPRVSDPRDKPTDAEGGLWSTVEDLSRWIGFQLSDGRGVLEPGSLLELLRPHAVSGPRWTSGQGLAWYHERRGERVFTGHSGGTLGYRSRIAFSVEDRVGTIVLANGEAPAPALALDLLERVVDARRAHLEPEATAVTTPVPDELGGHLGMYRWPGHGEVVRVEWRRGRLTLVWAGAQPPHPWLEPTDPPDRFVVRGGRETGERAWFDRETTGRVIGLTVASYPLERLEGPEV